MSYYNPLAYLVILYLLWLFVGARPFALLDKPWHTVDTRASAIDGLRGFLATGVFLHHASIYYKYLTQQSWETPPSNMLTQFGQASVSLFFMITGFLFWRKAIDQNGRLQWSQFYIGRIFRLSPLFYLAIAGMLYFVFESQGWQLLIKPETLARQIAPLALFGFYAPPPEINAYHFPSKLLAGVTWSLHFEWVFYLFFFPIGAWLLRNFSAPICISAALFISAAALVFIRPSDYIIALANFSAGMLTASLSANWRVQSAIKWLGAWSNAIIILLALTLLAFPTAYDFIPCLILSLMFFFIGVGGNLFGMLTHRASKRLGESSYGIYLFQGLVLHAALQNSPLKKIALQSPVHFCFAIALCGLFLLYIAHIAHVCVEWPAIKAGQRICKKISQSP